MSTAIKTTGILGKTEEAFDHTPQNLDTAIVHATLASPDWDQVNVYVGDLLVATVRNGHIWRRTGY